MYPFSEKNFDISVFMENLSSTRKTRVVIFGAGPFGEGLYRELSNREIRLPMVFSDNDQTKHHTGILDTTVIPPAALSLESDLVVIATLSGQEKISIELENIGFLKNQTYFPVMKNENADYPFYVVNFFSRYINSFHNKAILHIGPGGNLGVELLLCCLGGADVRSVEYNSYGIAYPDLSEASTFYRRLNQNAIDRYHLDLFQLRLLTYDDYCRLRINEEKIILHYPCSASDIPVADHTFDLVLHHAVFEHISHVDQAYGEIYRVLKPGGRMVGLVDPQDHRSFSSGGGYHPLQFLSLSREAWYEIARQISFHNQVTTPEHRQMILSKGFEIDTWENLDTMDICDEIWQTFHPMFKAYDRKELGILRFALCARKPEDG